MDVDRLVKRKTRAKRDGNMQQLAAIVKELGDLFFETGRLEDSLQEYLEQLQISESLQDKLNIAVAHRMIGEVYANLEDYEQALFHQNLYLGGATEMKNKLEEQRALATLGRTYFCLAESVSRQAEKKVEALANAKKAYSKSICLCNELENTNIEVKELVMMRARLLLNLGLVLEAQEDHKQAIELIEKAAILCEQNDFREDYHRTQFALGGIYDRRSNYEVALQHFENATKIDNESLKADARLSIAEILLKSERWKESRKMLVSLYTTNGLAENLKRRAAELLRIVATLHKAENDLKNETDSRNVTGIYETLGDAAVAAQCLNKAIEYYRQMLAFAEKTGSKRINAALTSLAQTLKDTGQYCEAARVARQELHLCTRPQDACKSALFFADILIAAGIPDAEIRKAYKRAEKSAKEASDVALNVTYLKDYSYYLERSGNIEEAAKLKRKLNELKKAANVVIDSSDDESESSCNIGEDISLDDLSDVERELDAKGNHKTLRKRVKKTTIIKKNEKGETPLHVACIDGNVKNVEKLLATGHPTNVRDNCGWTPLHEAANYGFTEIAKLLIEHGANVNDRGGNLCQGITPLHDAASCGNFTMMRLLMYHGADLALRTTNNLTVLDTLIDWRSRAEDLSPADLVEYNTMLKKLSGLIPQSLNTSRINTPGRSMNNSQRPSCSREENTAVEEGKETDEEDDSDDDRRGVAVAEYCKTIASLKHRADPIRRFPRVEKENVSPLIDCDLIVIDDMIEDDLSGSIEVVRTTPKTSSSKKRLNQPNTFNDRRVKKSKNNTGFEAKEIVASKKNLDINISGKRDVVKSVKSVKSAKNKQISLLSSGFTRQSESRTPSPTLSQESSSSHTDIQETSLPEMITLNILAEGKTYEMNLEFTKTKTNIDKEILCYIRQRFYEDTGCEATFDLKLMNGVKATAEILLNFLGGSKHIKELKCDTVELKIPSITDRYKTICKTDETDVRESVLTCLKSCENMPFVRLKRTEINAMEIKLVLKTLTYQKNTQILTLSGGAMRYAGIVLNRCINKLNILQELHLSNCDIDYKCLSKIERLPPLLKILDLSYNPLQSESHETLLKLLAPLKQLQTLTLGFCNLTDFQLHLHNNNIMKLDISWNHMDWTKVRCFLRSRLLCLNLSGIMSAGLIENKFGSDIFSMTNVETLELAFCGLIDNDVENILLQAPNLGKLVINGNSKLSAWSSNVLLKHTPTLRHIDVSGCITIDVQPDSNTVIANPDRCSYVTSMTLEVCDYWYNLWQSKAVMYKLPSDIVIFKPISGRGNFLS